MLKDRIFQMREVLKIIPAAMVCRGMVSFKIHALLGLRMSDRVLPF
jgi:hypothetical protein